MSSTKQDFKFEVLEFYGNVRGAEDNWGITVSKIRWGDDVPTINIRNTNLMKGIVGKGVALSDEETDTLVDVLLERDYGSVEAIEKALERRRNRFDYDEENLVPQAIWYLSITEQGYKGNLISLFLFWRWFNGRYI